MSPESTPPVKEQHRQASLADNMEPVLKCYVKAISKAQKIFRGFSQSSFT